MLLESRHLCCARRLFRDTVSTVHDVSLGFEPRTLNLLWGPEGCGKNLLVRLLGLLETADSGEVLVAGTPTAALGEPARTALRNRTFGFVFNEPFLLPSMTVIENIAMPLFRIASMEPEVARDRATRLLEFVGLNELAGAPADSLPVSQQQLVALARALGHAPQILIVEQIDARLQGEDLFRAGELLWKACSHFGVTTLVTARDAGLTPLAHRVIELNGGTVRHDLSRTTAV